MKFRNNFNFKQITFYLLEGGQFEAGYKGNFNNLNKDYTISSNNGNNVGNFLSNTLEYKEKLMLFTHNMVSK
jgi:hypothetical protein